MTNRNIYLLVLCASVLGLMLLLSNWGAPYSEIVGLSIILLAAILGRKYGLSYESLVKRKAETRIAGYLLFICGVMVLGFYPNAWPTPKIASGLLMFIGAMLVGVTLKMEGWKRL